MVASILLGHFILLVGIRLYIGLLGSESVKIKTFLKSRKFKWIAASYILVAGSAIAVPFFFL